VRSLIDTDRTVIDGIPVTSLARTLLDYAEVARPQELRHALEAAERRELFDLRAIRELLARCKGRRGGKALKAAIAELTGPAPWTRSELERRFLELIRQHELPEPHANVLVEGHLVDFHWPRQRLVVEVDGFEFHRSRRAFENDRARDAALQLAGQRVVRVTHRQLGEPAVVISRLCALLEAASGR
jgi:very-short-patch-repair endonuclease